MAVLLTPEVHDASKRSVLCWLATADEQGQPSVSPKEVFAVADSEHLVIANIASPGSARKIRANAKVCVSFIDVFVQKGFKVIGVATEVRASAPDFERWVEPLREMAGDRFRIRGVFVIRATAVEAIVAPSYRLYPAETTEASQVRSALRSYRVTRPEDRF